MWRVISRASSSISAAPGVAIGPSEGAHQVALMAGRENVIPSITRGFVCQCTDWLLILFSYLVEEARFELATPSPPLGEYPGRFEIVGGRLPGDLELWVIKRRFSKEQ